MCAILLYMICGRGQYRGICNNLYENAQTAELTKSVSDAIITETGGEADGAYKE